MRRSRLLCLILAVLPVAACRQAVVDDADLAAFICGAYDKREVRIPMRDGLTLHAAVYTPKDAGPSQTYPILLTRTPYSARPYGGGEYPEQLGPSEEFARERYIFVTEDVRGRFMSEGEYVNMRPVLDDPSTGTDERTDTWDTVEWLVGNLPHHNGRVGIWGNSYPGFYTAVGIIDTHPAVRAAMPSAPIADWYFDDMHHHGAFALNLAFNFLSSFGRPREGLVSEWPPRFDHGTPDGYRFFLELGPLANVDERHFHGEVAFWNELADHPDYDEFWAARSTLPHLAGIRCAVLTVGGLFDAEDLYGAFHTYAAIEELNPGIASSLVMGPWSHGAWLRGDGRRLGDADFGSATAEDFRRDVLLPFFAHHLKDGPAPEIPEAMVFDTGAKSWRSFESWPPAGLEQRGLFLAAAGALAWQPPAAAGTGFDAFVSDPAKPVPYTADIATGWHAAYMTEDQRFASRRPDVLVYRSEPLTEPLTLAGELQVELWVSTTAGDADWVVKLVDEHPGRLPGFDPESGEEDLGHSELLVRSEIFRGRYREGYDRPLPFTSGEVTRVAFPLQGVLHTFARGHRIAIHVQSSLFPFFDRNPQSWVANIFAAREADFVAATHRVYRRPAQQSAVAAGVLQAEVAAAAP